MVGAGIAAELAGWSREVTGSYDDAWWLAGGLCVLAAFAIFGIRRSPAEGAPVDGARDAGDRLRADPTAAADPTRPGLEPPMDS